MKEVVWTDDLSVNVGLIDKQHKMLIQHLNNLAKALELHQGPTKIVSILNFLMDYADFHFSTEEKHMTANDYPALEEHKMKHEEFRKILASLEEDFKEEGATPILAQSLDALLVHWLFKHIKTVDIEFGTFQKTHGIPMEEEG